MIKLLDPTNRRERRQLYKLVHESQRYQRVTLDGVERDDEAFAKLVHNIIRNNLRDPKLAYYLNWRDNRAVGHILLRELADGATVYIDDLGVDSAARRQGVAGELLDFAEQWARDRSFPKLKLSTQRDNEAARAAYETAGFHEVPSQYIDLEKALS
jgi:ribosomal protein S18 acetylase RimI-like enzyme